MNFELTEENFTMFAVKNYDNPSCNGMDEFLDDLKRFKYIKRLLRKHNVGKELKERLILNHIIVLGNLFGIDRLSSGTDLSGRGADAHFRQRFAEGA